MRILSRLLFLLLACSFVDPYIVRGEKLCSELPDGADDLTAKRFGPAVKTFQRFLGTPRHQLAANYCTGLAYEGLGKADEAISYYYTASRLDRKNPKFHLTLASALITLERPDDAAAVLRSALKTLPKNIAILNKLGWLAHKKGANKSAGEYFKRAAELNPESGHATAGLALYSLEKGERLLALKQAHSATIFDPTDSFAREAYRKALHFEKTLQSEKSSQDPLATMMSSDGLVFRSGRINLLRNKDLKSLSAHPSLLAFSLESSFITPQGLSPLAAIKELRYLHLGPMFLTGKGLRQVANLPELSHLILDGTALVDPDLSSLTRLRTLQELSLQRNNIHGAGLRHVAALQNLEVLRLDGTPLEDEGLRHLRSLSNLKNLSLGYTRVTDSGLEQLLALPSLRALNLVGTRVSQNGLKKIARLPSLRFLFLGATGMTDSERAQFRRTHPRLSVRYHWGNPSI